MEPRANRVLFVLLLLASLVGSLATVPYTLTLLHQSAGGMSISIRAVVISTLLQDLVLSALTGAVGLWLGDKIGLGAADLRALLAGTPSAWRWLWTSLPLALLTGLLTGIALLMEGALLGSRILPAVARSQTIAAPPAWQGVLASFAAGAAGIVYRWFYWRRGLVLAMLAQAATDVIIHGLAALSRLR